MSSNLHINGPITRFYNYIRLHNVEENKTAVPTERGLMALSVAYGTIKDTAMISVEDSSKVGCEWKYLVHTITADTNIRALRDASSGVVELVGPDIRPGEGVSIGKLTDASGNPYVTIGLNGSGFNFETGYGLRMVNTGIGKNLQATYRLYTVPITAADLDANGRCWIPDVYIENGTGFWLTAVYTESGQQTYPDIYLSDVQVTIKDHDTLQPISNATKYIICIDFKSVDNFNAMSGNTVLYCKVFVENTAAYVYTKEPVSEKPGTDASIDIIKEEED